MKCGECGYEDSVLKFMTTAPAFWIEEGMKDENVSAVVLKCPKCGAVKT